MAVSHNRTRAVSFRVTEHEYKKLIRLSREQGAHSISDYARTMALMTANITSSIPELKTQAQAAEIRHLIQQVHQEIEALRQRLGDLENVVGGALKDIESLRQRESGPNQELATSI